MSSAPKPSGENWSRAAKDYNRVVDENDALNPAGAACKHTLDIVNSTLPFDRASYVIDMGTGPGPLISSVLSSSKHAAQIPSDARIVASDVAQGLLEILAERKVERQEAEPIWQRLEIKDWDARDLKEHIKDGEVSHLLSSYAYFAFANEKETLAEAYRILKPGGLFTETSMGYTEWGYLPQLINTVRPDKAVPGPGAHWQSMEGVRATLEAAGFKDVQAKEFEIGIPFETHEGPVEFVFNAFPYVKGFVADMSEAEVKEVQEKMLEFVKSRHPEAPLVLNGTGLIGWGRK